MTGTVLAIISQLCTETEVYIYLYLFNLELEFIGIEYEMLSQNHVSVKNTSERILPFLQVVCAHRICDM